MTPANEPSSSDNDRSERTASLRVDAATRAFRWSLAVIAAAAVIVGGGVWWASKRTPKVEARTPNKTAPRVRDLPTLRIPDVRFTDVTQAAGIDFVHVNGAYGDKLLPETMGSGCAFCDFDNDDDQDLLLVNSCYWPWDQSSKAEAEPTPTAILYQNDGTGRFEDVTSGSGLDVTFYGTGVAVGDVNGDGLSDLFISAVGPNRFFVNRGNGRFEEQTANAGLAGGENEWSTSCGFFDYDRDGDLDLFVCNYVQWSKDVDLAQEFSLTGVGRAYGPPVLFEGTFPYLYRNEGGGTFSDVSSECGIQVVNPATGVPMAKSLGLTFADLEDDGWIDVLVANDTVQNFVFHNRGDRTFEEIGASSGMGYDSAGKARGAMGIDSGLFRNDGALGVAIGNFANEMTALYVSQGQSLLFADEAIAAGLGPPSRLELTFGVLFFDYDLDGRLDLLSANGHLEEEIGRVQAGVSYRQAARLFWNAGPEHASEFVSVSPNQCGRDLFTPLVGRGSAYADIDGDGDLDVLLTQVAGQPLLLRNEANDNSHYLRFKLIGTQGNRDAIGACVEVTVGEQTLRRQVMPTRSYLSQAELPVTIGLGKRQSVDRIVVRWPDGHSQQVSDYRLDDLTTVERRR